MFSKDPFDRERYEHVRSVAADMLASCADMNPVLINDLLRGEHGVRDPQGGRPWRGLPGAPRVARP